MIKNYITIALRTLLRNKGYSIINIGGLAAGMTIAILIGLWVYDELSYNKYHANYSRLARVMQHQMYNGEIGTDITVPIQMAQELRDNYGSDFKYVTQASWEGTYLLAVGEKRIMQSGQFFEPQITDMLSLRILSGVRSGLQDPYSIMLSESVARTFFGDAENALNKTMRFMNQHDLKVTGVYEDLPYNSSFKHLSVLLPFDLYLISNPWIKGMEDLWGSNFTHAFAMLHDHADFSEVSTRIKDAKLNKVSQDEKKFKAQIFLHPMAKWHLYSDFKNGINTGGRIEYVWLFGVIGVFVLLLACINFMNLSTARSEKRAKEVGIRKAIGSARLQLIYQFFSESFLTVCLAFVLSISLVSVILPTFNEIADKRISMLWSNPVFWCVGLSVCLVTGFIAGSYPALYLSSFESVKILKGTFRVGRLASVPRKVLVVFQFTVSVTLVISTIVVHQQINFAKNRPLGYDRDGLVQIPLETAVYEHFETIRNELKNSGSISEMAFAKSPLTEIWSTNSGFDWEGKDPGLAVDFPNNAVSYEFGETVGWTIKEGRDFSRQFSTDSAAFILNEAAVRYIGLADPVGKTIRWNGIPYTVVGVVKDVLQESPYGAVRPSFFHLARYQESVVIIKLNQKRSVQESLRRIESVLKRYTPDIPFLYTFVDDAYARKFGNEERVGKLATAFAILAIFISCLGLFGLASFVSELRTKEIGIRKVVGASNFSLWRLLSKDFAILVMVACLVATPVAYYFTQNWLQRFQYRVEISWSVFLIAQVGAMIITLVTVGYQAFKVSLSNPVKSLRSE
jgi:putative ABC transport system permease protein